MEKALLEVRDHLHGARSDQFAIMKLAPHYPARMEAKVRYDQICGALEKVEWALAPDHQALDKG